MADCVDNLTNDVTNNVNLNKDDEDGSTSLKNKNDSCISVDDSFIDETDTLGATSLKKDDSGISMEKSSPLMSGKETSDGEGNDSTTFNDSASFSMCDNPPKVNSDSKPSSSKSDFSDKVSSEIKITVDSSDDQMEETSDLLEATPAAPLADGVEGDDEDETFCESSESRRRRMRIRDRILRSDSDSDSDSDDDDNDDDDNDEQHKDKESSESCSSEGEEIQLHKPKEIWHAVHDLRNRELGYSNKTPPSLFRERVQGSVSMVQRLELQFEMECHDGCVNALNFNRIGTLLASSSDDLNIVLWNWVQNKPALVYDSGHRSNVFQAKFMPYSGDCHVVSCARDGQVRLAELSLTGRCKETKKLAQHKGAAHKLALELDSPHIFLSCGEDAVTFEVDLRQEKPNKLAITKENDRKVGLYSIHSNPVNSNEFCVGGRDHYIRIYDKRKISESENNGVLKKFCPHHLVDCTTKANITCACYNYNGTEVLGSYNDEDIYLFDNKHSDGAEYIHKYKGHRNNATVKGVNFYGPRSEFIVSGSDCGHVFLWDKETENIVQFLKGDEGGVINVLEPHPFAPILATSGLDHDVKIWSPTAEDAPGLPGLRKSVRRNRKEREEERSEEPEMIDGQMLWLVMHHFRRSARRQLRQEGGDVSSSSENMEEESDDSEEEADRLQCAPS